MIKDWNGDPYLICGWCKRAFNGRDAENYLTDGWIEGPEDTDDPSEYLYSDGYEVECPYCGYRDIYYAVHLPYLFTVSCGNRSLSLSYNDIVTPPKPKFSLGGFSLKKPSGFSLSPPAGFSLANRKSPTEGMRRVPPRDRGRRGF